MEKNDNFHFLKKKTFQALQIKLYSDQLHRSRVRPYWNRLAALKIFLIQDKFLNLRFSHRYSDNSDKYRLILLQVCLFLRFVFLLNSLWIRIHVICLALYIATSSVQFSCSVMSDSLRPHELQHTRPPCPSPTPGVHSDSCPSSQWCHPAVSSSVVPFSSCLQSLPASESFPMISH